MSESGKRFPLSLAELDERKSRAPSAGNTDRSAGQTRTPQTATRNVASHLGTQGQRSSSALQGNAARDQPFVARAGAGAAAAIRPPSQPAATGQRASASPSDGLRRAMVERVAQQGVRDGKVLAALQAVPRHLFIQPALSGQAYIDASLPIGHHQTISQPYIVARMIEVMRDNGNDGKLNRVLEIGTGCGYQAAVLSLVAKEVYSIERIRPLHELAKANLRPLRIANIRLQFGDGMLGLPQVAPFDGIILAAAGLEVPAALLEQLSIGGRLVAPVGGRQQVLQLIERKSRIDWSTATLEDCHFVPLRPGTA